MKYIITKTLIKSCLDCQRRLYLELNKPELKTEAEDAFLSYLGREGYVFEGIAQTLFPNSDTQMKVTSKGVHVRCDVVDENLTEIKSSTSIKEEHILDITIQAQILSELNIPIKKYQLAYVNKNYVFINKLVTSKFVKIDDVTDRVNEILPEVKIIIDQARKTAQMKRTPKRETGRHCSACPFVKNCFPEIIDYTVTNLRRGGKKIDELLGNGIHYLKDISEDVALSSYQQLQVAAELNGKDVIDKKEVKSILNTLVYPIWFLDFEAAPILTPRYKGCSAYLPLTFQVSVHLQESKGAELKHVEFLHNQDSDPRYNLALFLDEHIGDKGSVVAYHASYEKGRLQELADKSPELTDKMNSIIERLWDLETIFTKGYYLSPKFEGSTSIKKVLPVLLPNTLE